MQLGNNGKEVGKLKRDLGMLFLTCVSLGIIAWVEVYDLDWPNETFKQLAVVDLCLVGIFLTEFLVRLARADSKKEFLLKNWYEIPGLVPLYADTFSWLRATKVLRIIRVVRLLRVVSALQRLKRSVRFINLVLSRSHLGTTFVLAALVTFMGAVSFWIAEHRTNKALDSYDDALWWAMSTTTTVGYGDITPQTGPGRLVASVLMLVGIGLVGVVASSLSSALLTTRAESKKSANDLVGQLEALVRLKETGHLSDEEFTQAKAKLLGSEAEQPS